MKTTIIDELKLEPQRRSVLARYALRRGVPLAVVIKEIVEAKADVLLKAAKKHGLSAAA